MGLQMETTRSLRKRVPSSSLKSEDKPSREPEVHLPVRRKNRKGEYVLDYSDTTSKIGSAFNDKSQSPAVRRSSGRKKSLRKRANAGFSFDEVFRGEFGSNSSMRIIMQSDTSKIKCSVGPFSWQKCSSSSVILIGLLLCYSTSQPSYAESPEGGEKNEGYSYNKKIMTDYSVIGIPGDGRCLFRSVVHGSCVKSGNQVLNEDSQRQLADELRARIEVETVDRTGTFLGNLWESRINVAILLLKAGLAKLQTSFGHDGILYAHFLVQAEQSAKQKNLKMGMNDEMGFDS